MSRCVLTRSALKMNSGRGTSGGRTGECPPIGSCSIIGHQRSEARSCAFWPGCRIIWNSVGRRKFHLVHGCLSEDRNARIWGRVTPDSRSPYPDTICIVGHTPTCFLTGKMDEEHRIWHGNNLIDIDCGCGNLRSEHRRLACLRLDDMAEFYVGNSAE